MVRAFVFGKFLPFHKGHQAMISFALTKCDYLTVLICCSDKENVTSTTRKRWIEETFNTHSNINIQVFEYLEEELPNSSETSDLISSIWAPVFKKMLPDHSILVTSEPYGELVAGYMNIQHIYFDIEKKRFPISASSINKDVFTTWNYLPNSVKPDYITKIVMLGTESTGKTTLAESLSRHYKCGLVLEAGREIIPNSESFEFDDLTLVANEHSQRIADVVIGDSPMIIIDTDIHITKSYSKFTFDKELQVSESIMNTNKADLYLYLNNDVEYYQDGTRLKETERDLLDSSHRQILHEHGISFVEIKGNWDERFESAVNHIDKLIDTKKPMHRR